MALQLDSLVTRLRSGPRFRRRVVGTTKTLSLAWPSKGPPLIDRHSE